jgi:hypothetical protein
MSLHGRASGRAILSEDAIVHAAAHRRRARLAHRQSRQEIFEMLHALRRKGYLTARSPDGPAMSVAA